MTYSDEIAVGFERVEHYLRTGNCDAGLEEVAQLAKLVAAEIDALAFDKVEADKQLCVASTRLDELRREARQPTGRWVDTRNPR